MCVCLCACAFNYRLGAVGRECETKKSGIHCPFNVNHKVVKVTQNCTKDVDVMCCVGGRVKKMCAVC